MLESAQRELAECKEQLNSKNMPSSSSSKGTQDDNNHNTSNNN